MNEIQEVVEADIHLLGTAEDLEVEVTIDPFFRRLVVALAGFEESFYMDADEARSLAQRLAEAAATADELVRALQYSAQGAGAEHQSEAK